MDRERRLPVAYLCGVPRYRIGRAVRGLLRLANPVVWARGSQEADRFEDELSCWDLAGVCWGKHFYRVPRSSEAQSASQERPIGGGYAA